MKCSIHKSPALLKGVPTSGILSNGRQGRIICPNSDSGSGFLKSSMREDLALRLAFPLIDEYGISTKSESSFWAIWLHGSGNGILCQEPPVKHAEIKDFWCPENLRFS